MDALAILLVVVIALIALDVAALRWGVDSRPGLTDDHVR
jgi:nitrogen fixation-related uncharacterized protein